MKKPCFCEAEEDWWACECFCEECYDADKPPGMRCRCPRCPCKGTGDATKPPS